VRVYVCVCMCMYERGKERGTKRESAREGEKAHARTHRNNAREGTGRFYIHMYKDAVNKSCMACHKVGTRGRLHRVFSAVSSRCLAHEKMLMY